MLKLLIVNDSVLVFFSQIRGKAKGTFSGNQQPACVDSPVDKNANNKPIKLWPCHSQGGNQVRLNLLLYVIIIMINNNGLWKVNGHASLAVTWC